MKQIKINLEGRSYSIKMGCGLLDKLNLQRFNADKYAIITDLNVKKLYGDNLENKLKKEGLDVISFEIPAGESSKNWKLVGALGRELAKNEFSRDSLILALGGGVVGDLAGFLASFYKRGVRYIQIPTTLLAQVDSSIGGKTGVNILEGKNIFGSFYHPKEVLIDVRTLETLPEKEIRNGLAEIIKYGMINDHKLFRFLEKNYLHRDSGIYTSLIKRSCEIKAEIVIKDEKEAGLRKILNYGHTIGHAIETFKKYKISHGEAVGLGMIYEGKISSMLGLLDKKALERQNQLIRSIGLPVKYNDNPDKLIKIMKRDKKAKEGKIYFVLPTAVGKVKKENGQIVFPINESLIRRCFRE